MDAACEALIRGASCAQNENHCGQAALPNHCGLPCSRSDAQSLPCKRTPLPVEGDHIRIARCKSDAANSYVGSTCFGQQRQLAWQGATIQVGPLGWIVAGEAMVAEWRIDAVPPVVAHGAIKPINGKELQRVGAEERAQLLERETCRQQLFP